MVLYMLDTDISSYLIRGDHPEVTEAFRKHFPNCCISCITAAELLFGAKKRNSKILTQNVKAYCDLLPIRDWTADAARAYAGIRLETEANGTPLGSMDMLIAASAMAEGAILVTNNTAHFSKVSKLKIENWTNESLETFHALRAQAKESGISGLPLSEINAEICKARKKQ